MEKKITKNKDTVYIDKIISTKDGDYITAGKINKDNYEVFALNVSGKNGYIINESVHKTEYGFGYLAKAITINTDIYVLYSLISDDSNSIVLVKINNSGQIL